MEKLKKIIFDIDVAFKEKDKNKIASGINYLKDNNIIDNSLHKSFLNQLNKLKNLGDNANIEDKFCLVFTYSNQSLNFYFLEFISALILSQMHGKIVDIGFSGKLFAKLCNLLYGIILPPLVRLLFIKPLAPILFLIIHNGYFYSLGINGFGTLNTNDRAIGGVMGPFSGIVIDILAPHEEYIYISNFLFLFGISGVVIAGDVIYFP